MIRQLLASKGIAAFFLWPTTPGNFVRIFCHLCRCVKPCPISFLMKTVVSSVHVTVSIVIRCRLFCTLRASCRFHIICYRIPSRRQCCHHQTISLHEYPRHPLHYGSERSTTTARHKHHTCSTDISKTNCQIDPNECD